MAMRGKTGKLSIEHRWCLNST